MYEAEMDQILTSSEAVNEAYLWWDIIDILVSHLASSVLSFSWEVIHILAGKSSGTQGGWDVIDLLCGLADCDPLISMMLLGQDRWRNIINVFWNWWLIVIADIVVQVLARSDGNLVLQLCKMWWHVICLFSD